MNRSTLQRSRRAIEGCRPLPSPRLAHGYAEAMNRADLCRHRAGRGSGVGDATPRALEQAAHPLAAGRRVGRKVEHHRQAGLQQRHDHESPITSRRRPGVAHIVVDRLLLVLVEAGEPGILADQERGRPRRELGGERRFSGGDLAADHVERRTLPRLPFRPSVNSPAPAAFTVAAPGLRWYEPGRAGNVGTTHRGSTEMTWQPEMDELRRRQEMAQAHGRRRQGQAPARWRPAHRARAHRPAGRPGLVPRDRQRRRQGRV